MTNYLLDTNACIRYFRDPNGSIGKKLAILPLSNIRSCEIVAAELFHGAYKSIYVTENLKLVKDFLKRFDTLRFDRHAAQIYGKIRVDLEKVGQCIGPNDLQIAAIALTNDVTLVTHNVSEFSRVVGLKIEDWEAIKTN